MRDKILIFTVFILATFVACNDFQYVDEPSTNEVTFSSGVDGVQSKVINDLWDVGDSVGVFMIGSPAYPAILANGGVGTTNVHYKTINVPRSDSTLFIPVDNGIEWGTGTYNFIAYYPYNADYGFDDIYLDTRDQTNLKALDFIYGVSSRSVPGFTSAHVGAVNIRFTHVCAKLVFVIKAGNGISKEELKDMTISIRKMKFYGTFDLSGQATSFMTPTVARTDLEILESVNILPVGDTVKVFEGIIIPQDVKYTGINKNTISFHLNNEPINEVFTYEIEPFKPEKFKYNNQYTFTITINRTSASARSGVSALEVTNKVEPWQ